MSYGGHEVKVYYTTESGAYGQTPLNPVMHGFDNATDVEPAVDPNNIKVRGIGSRDLTEIHKGLRQVNLKVAYPLPSDNVLDFLQHILTLYPQTIEVIYDKSGSIVDLRHMGCIMDKATVACSVEDVVKAAVDLIGQNLIPETAKIAGATYTDFGGVIPWSESYVQRGAADGSALVAIEEVTDWSFTIENNLKRVAVIRSNPTSLLTATAAAAQKVVAVASGALFKTENMVFIEDTATSERNIVKSIAGNNLTMLNNLEHTYTVAAAGKTTALTSDLLKYLQERNRVLTGEVTFEFENRAEYYDVVNDSEFSLKFGLGLTNYALFKYCKWDNINAPTKSEDLISLKAPFTAREVTLV